jgi:acetyl-CoA carboxylase biotin carboxyl carrier protein
VNKFGANQLAEIKVLSDVTGVVWKIEVKPGVSVAEGDAIIIVESMKMEIPVEAPESGKVVSIQVAEEEAVSEGQEIAIIDIG